MAAIMLQTFPSLYAKFSEKNLLISAKTYEKYIVRKDYCIGHHDKKTCFLPTCKYHIIIRGNVEELLKKLDTFCYTYQHVDCIHYSSIDSVEKLLQRVDKCLITCNKQLTLLKETREGTECRELQKRGSCGKTSKSIYSVRFERQKQRRPVDQCSQKELNKLKRLNLS